MTSAILVEGVSKSFGPTKALDSINLTIERGDSRALIGKNGAGKSTLMSILTGLVHPDSGSVTVVDENGDTGFSTVGCVYQRSTLVPAATAAENIALNRYPTRRRVIQWRQVRRDAVAALRDWGSEEIADTPVELLDPLERKIVEICRVLASGPKILLLDEPTAGLDRPAVRKLFDNVKRARARGVTVIFVSHHLHEVFEVCDSVTVLRDGRTVMSDKLERLTVPDLVQAMVGETAAEAQREVLAHTAETRVDTSGVPVLAVRGLVAEPKVHSVDLELRAGECVGLTGIDGAGHMQVAQLLTGQVSPDAGEVALDGTAVRLGSIPAAIRAGIGFTPEDRHLSGFVPYLSVAENATLGILPQLTGRFRLISGSRRDAAYGRLAEEWSIKAKGPHQAAEELSGGNQQKVVLARSVATEPKLLVLVNPTAGVDVQAKRSIYSTIDDLKRRGQSVLVVTSDDGDLEICDRILVMFEGSISAELHPPFSERQLAAAVQGARLDDQALAASSTAQGEQS